MAMYHKRTLRYQDLLRQLGDRSCISLFACILREMEAEFEFAWSSSNFHLKKNTVFFNFSVQ